MKSIFVIGLFLPLSAHAAAVEWNIDKTHSHVGFGVRHLALTNVKGEFTDFSGVIKADDKTGKLEAVDGAVKVASLTTGNAKRDNHLKSDDFFAAAKFPELKLKTTAIRWNGNELAADAELTIRGVTKPVTFKGECVGVQKLDFGDGPQLRNGCSARAKINRKDFGLNWAKAVEAVPIVADDVAIELDVEFSRKASEAKAG